MEGLRDDTPELEGRLPSQCENVPSRRNVISPAVVSSLPSPISRPVSCLSPFGPCSYAAEKTSMGDNSTQAKGRRVAKRSSSDCAGDCSHHSLHAR